MICPECKGERAVYRNFQNRITLTPCPTCNGVGEVVLTNFDRITASPEKLAEFLWKYTHDLLADWEHINDPMFRHMPLKNVLGDNCTKKEAWVEWLKEIHE